MLLVKFLALLAHVISPLGLDVPEAYGFLDVADFALDEALDRRVAARGTFVLRYYIGVANGAYDFCESLDWLC